MAAPVGLKNSNYDLQFIRDLYDKMFPNAKDYIKFLQEEINQCQNEKSNRLFDKILKQNKKEKKYHSPVSNRETPNDHINYFEKDYWEGLEKKDILFFKLLTRNWLKTNQRDKEEFGITMF